MQVVDILIYKGREELEVCLPAVLSTWLPLSAMELIATMPCLQMVVLQHKQRHHIVSGCPPVA